MKWRTAPPRYSAGHRPTRVRKRISGRTVTGRGKGSIIGGGSGAVSREEEDEAMGEVRLSASDLAVDEGYDGQWSVVQAGPESTTYDHLASALEEYDLEDDCAPPALPPPPPAFGEIVIQDSTDIHIGNKTFYNGSVTIKQFVFPKDEEKLRLPSATPESNGTLARSNAYLCDATKDEQKDDNKLRHLKSPYVIGAAILLALIVTSLIVFFVTTKPEDGMLEVPGVKIVSRGEWLAVSPVRPVRPQGGRPAEYAIVEQTGERDCPSANRSCATEVRYLQGGRVFNGLNDIASNFLIGGDGQIYEGLGWDKTGYGAGQLSTRSLSVAFIGNFTDRVPGPGMVNASRTLLSAAVQLGRLRPDYKLIYLGQAVGVAGGAGAALAALVRSWPHWAPCDTACRHLAEQPLKYRG